MHDNLKPLINILILIGLTGAFIVFFLFREIVILFFACVIAILLQGRRAS